MKLRMHFWIVDCSMYFRSIDRSSATKPQLDYSKSSHQISVFLSIGHLYGREPQCFGGSKGHRFHTRPYLKTRR